MLICPYCGAQNEESNAFCSNCGASLRDSAAAGQQQSFDANQQETGQPTFQQGSWNPVPQPVAPIPTGGLMAWSIITLLLCTIPGVIALVNTMGINKAMTLEEQQKKVSTARMCCIIGTVLGVLAVIGRLAAGS